MKHSFFNRALSLLLALVCIMGVLPLSAFAAEGLSSAPGSITQKSSAYMTIGGRSVRYKAASSTINNVGLPYVFNEQVDVPGFGSTRALCAYQKGTLGPAANGQKWNFKSEANSASLKVLLTYIYSCTYGNFTDAGDAVGLEHWSQYWSDIWFLVAQAMSWYYEHGIIIDVNSNKEGFIEQAAEEFVAAMKLYHETYGQSSWITDWNKIGTHSIIDSSDGGKTGYSAYDYIATGVNMVLEHPEYFHDYHLWIYEWDSSQPWKLAGQSGVPMQRLLVAVPEERTVDIDTVMDLQERLNPEGRALRRGATIMRLGDPVMQTANSRERGVYNGEIGCITEVNPDEQTLKVTFSDGRTSVYARSELSELTLAYATTVHKLQGSEAKNIIIPVTMAHKPMLYRNLLYTGVSRATDLCILVGEEEAIRYAVENTPSGSRHSNFKYRLRKDEEP